MSIRIKELDSNELLRQVLLNERNIKDYKINYSKNGKPFLVDSDIYFNYSRSNSLTALVTSKIKNGICIKHYFYDEKIMDESFNEKEKNIVENSKDKKIAFTEIYTLKIAYLKMNDYDKNYSLKNIDTSTLKNWEETSNNEYIVSVIYDK